MIWTGLPILRILPPTAGAPKNHFLSSFPESDMMGNAVLATGKKNHSQAKALVSY